MVSEFLYDTQKEYRSMEKVKYPLLESIFWDVNRYYYFGTREDALRSSTLVLAYAVLKYLVVSKGFRAVFFYRLHHGILTRRIRIVGGLVLFIELFFIPIEISPRAVIGPGLFIPHPQCIVIGRNAVLGRNVTVYQGVTVGSALGKAVNGRSDPVIGDNVMLGAGSKVLGPVSIGSNSIVGANSVVVRDIGANSTAVGAPAVVAGPVKEPFLDLLKEEALAEWNARD